MDCLKENVNMNCKSYNKINNINYTDLIELGN